jgi:CBS domain-containing protein
MAFGLPVEGDDGPFLGEQLQDAASCDVHQTVADARRLLDGAGEHAGALVLSDGLVVGEVDAEALEGAADDAELLDVMRPVPSTVRPSVTVASLAQGGGGSAVVTDSDGRLLGHAVVDAADDHEGHDCADHEGHDHEGHDHGGHDHEGHDHGGEDAEYEQELAEVMQALQERFGDNEPSEEQVRAFLRDRLVAEGRSAEEAERVLQEMEGER